MSRSDHVSKLALTFGAAMFVVASANPVFGQGKEVTLASQGSVRVTTEDYEASILRIPEKERFGYLMSQERVNREIEGILRTRIVANEGKRLGLDADPTIKARINLYAERLVGEAYAAKIDAETIKEFEAKKQIYNERAREQYLINKSQYQTPAEVKASHILIRPVGQTADEALAKAKALRARILAGESFVARWAMAALE